MPIAIENADTVLKFTEESFKDEDELQRCLARSPYLLVSDSEPLVVTVQREISLPSAGILDLLVVDASGTPIAVEVKLAKNSQSRREVVAQAFDYVSDLTQLTVDELDDLVDGALNTALEKLEERTDADELWKRCGTNLRAGMVKLIVAVDQAKEDLVRIIRYINDHSDLDISLVSISKFDSGRIYVPNILVSGEKSACSRLHSAKRHQEIDSYFASVIELYNKETPDELKTRGRGKTYRQMRYDDWPNFLHYEFCNYPDSIGVELHLESDDIRHLSDTLARFDGSPLTDNVLVAWDQKWSRKRGRLLARISKENPADVCIQAMKSLIKLTEQTIK